MNDHPEDGQAQERRAAAAQDAGLCARCVHLQIVTSHRGSRFFLCRLSTTDPAFPRYPSIPVTTCAGFTDEEPK